MPVYEHSPTGQAQAAGTHRPAFALVVSLMLMSLILLIALGLTGLASIEIRRSASGYLDTQARANARLALMLAIGQLQRTLGPDQRVSASAEISGKTIAEPHWTGVWRTTMPDGKPMLTRDDLAGGLSDARWTGKVSARISSSNGWSTDRAIRFQEPPVPRYFFRERKVRRQSIENRHET